MLEEKTWKKVIGPNLPKNMRTQSITLLPACNVVVRLADKPTVPKAENTSKNMLSMVAISFACSMPAIETIAISIATIPKTNKDIALRMVLDENALLKATTCFPLK